MSIFIKSVFKSFKSNIVRFFLVLSIIFISLTLSSGLGSTTPTMEKSFECGLKSNHISDVIIKNTSEQGFGRETLSFLKNYSFSYYEDYLSFDEQFNNEFNRIYYKNLDKNNVNELTLIEGYLPTNAYEVVVEEKKGNRFSYHIGDEIKLSIFNNEVSVKVSGIVYNSLYSTSYNEPFLLDTNKSLTSIIYFSSLFDLASFPKDILIKNEFSARIGNDFSLFSNKYQSFIQENIKAIKKGCQSDELLFLSLKENASFAFFEKSCEKIALISWIFPFFFILVCTLVCSISFSKYISDDRSIIACYVSLGINENKILLKYLVFSLSTILIGGLLGVVVGLYLLPAAIFPTFNIIATMPKLIYSHNILIGLLSLFFIMLINTFLVVALIKNNFKETPASLLKAKAPKPGKKIFLEHIPFIWKHLKFKVKSSIRNIFRYKKNSLLTVIAMGGSSILLFLGLGLLDNSLALKNSSLYGNIEAPMKSISLIITFLALLLSALIIFNLANMNITSRNRELATLKVLGYTDNECSFYTFREILSLTIAGSLFALPIGYLIFKYVMIWLDFGSVKNIKWHSYVLSVLLVDLISLIVNLFLFRKIKNIDMNDSLKTLE